MSYTIPDPAQRAFLDRLIEASGPDLAMALRHQFEGALVAEEEHCPVCFTLKIVNRSVPIPRNLGQPLSFGVAGSAPDTQAVDVLLWHHGGFIESVEISWVGDEHPGLGDIALETR